MEIIDYSCRECEPNLTYYYDLELIRSVIDSNYITIVKYNAHCSNCSNLNGSIVKQGSPIHKTQVIKSGTKWQFHVTNFNRKTTRYLLNSGVIFQKKSSGGDYYVISEKVFLNHIEDDIMLYSFYVKNKQHDDGFYRDIVQKITSMGFEIQDLVFENHYFMTIIKKSPMTKPARKM